MTPEDHAPRLLAGPPPGAGPERLSAHVARLGALPRGVASAQLVGELEASGLLGRGGAGFPVGRKWRAMAARPRGEAVILANGAEGEPASFKDRVLMATRPHLVIDGAVLAAEAVGAREIVLYLGGEHTTAVAAMRRALLERTDEARPAIRVVDAPVGYVAGEATAAVHYVNEGDARPTTAPPRMSQRGVGGHPTLVQNVESLAYAALIARYGAGWYRTAGRAVTRGTGLVTLTGAGERQGVREIELGTTLGEVAAASGVAGPEAIQAVVLGGYFGTWARTEDAWNLPLDPAVMRETGLTFGCGIIGLLPEGRCGVAATAEIMGFMADESAGQCGPCVYGLRALGEATARVAGGRAEPDDLERIDRWTAQVPGRGACHHPDGAVQLLASALEVFGEEFRRHARFGRCSAPGMRVDVA